MAGFSIELMDIADEDGLKRVALHLRTKEFSYDKDVHMPDTPAQMCFVLIARALKEVGVDLIAKIQEAPDAG
jgi:hypothetical protein